MLHGASRSSSAPTAMSRSTKSRVCRSCRNCALQGPPQFSTSTVQIKLVGMGVIGKSQGCYAPNLWWLSCIWMHSYFNSCRLSLRNWKASSSVDTRNRLTMKFWPFVVKAHRGNHWGFLFIKDHESFPRPDASAFPEVSSDDLLHPREGWYWVSAMQTKITLLFGGKEPWSTPTCSDSPVHILLLSIWIFCVLDRTLARNALIGLLWAELKGALTTATVCNPDSS
jgi:hypothetical protein